MARGIRGILPIVHTPFTDSDEIDIAALKGEIDWAFTQGSDGIGTGMVSEIMRLTYSERIGYAKTLVELTAGRGAVFMAVGAESTKQAIEYSKEAERAGCDAVMAVPPLTAKLNEASMTEHFRALADAIAIPLIVQDASSYVGQSIPLGVYVKLLEKYGPDKILFKPEAAPNGPNISALRDATGGKAHIFEGSGGIYSIDSHRRGIAGTMPGVDVLDGVAALWRALERGDDATAYRVYFPVCGIVTLQLQAGLDGFLAIEKYLMVKRGLFPSARRRKPYWWELDAETERELDRLYDLLQAALR
ncbi:MAG: dihydrodipicolinate synthase family protein [Gemmataceae bacterium]|nr:dihydrodipicolinate synthase family protein [Gemmataceae bacterium]